MQSETLDQPNTTLSLHQGGRKINERWIWQRLSFSVKAGASLAVVGPSGSGKSLLLRALAGLDRLDEGTILLRKVSMANWAMPDYRSHVMYLPQTPALLEGTVLNNLRLVFEFAVHKEKSFDRDQILDQLRRLGKSEDFLQRSIDVLSGGERQIVAFLRALQLHPSVLLLDEPTASLDAVNTRQIEELVTLWLAGAPDRCAIWTSHQREQVQRMTTDQLELPAFES
ncbi:MAG: ATP-binding cassette domain-containing protein [Bacteroidetes bacterium]|nr:ATP-binding cassette domain-containing protein [Bacteroidota bacterium]